MTLYKLIKRGQRIKELMESFPEKENNSKQPQYLIDRSFKRSEIEGCSTIQKTLFRQKVNQLISKEKEQLEGEVKSTHLALFLRKEKSVRNYVNKNQNIKAASCLSTPQLKKEDIKHHISTRRVYLERKYHSKLAFQYQNIIQAKQIQDSRDKLKAEMDDMHESPLVRNTIKISRTQRKTAGYFADMSSKQFFRSNDTSRVDMVIDCSSSRKVLKNEKIREALDARDRKYVQPVTFNQSNNLKKYSSSFHFATLRPSAKMVNQKE